jgi:hypothetical protein
MEGPTGLSRSWLIKPGCTLDESPRKGVRGSRKGVSEKSGQSPFLLKKRL